MKRNKFYIIVFLITVLFCGTLITVSFAKKTFDNNLSFKVKSNKNIFLPGEIVNLEFEFLNKGNNEIGIWSNAIEAGIIKVLVAKDGGEYRNYPKGGKVKGKLKILHPNELYTAEMGILWNGKPNYSHLNSDAAKEADNMDKRILTDFVFPDAGVFYIKAVSFYKEGNKLKDISIPASVIESKPIKITVKEPIGEDLEVWNRIKDNGNIAYFIQEGDIRIPSYKTQEREKLKQKIEQIINQYPNSFYAESLQQSLTKFRSIEEKRQEYLQKIQKQQEEPQ